MDENIQYLINEIQVFAETPESAAPEVAHASEAAADPAREGLFAGKPAARQESVTPEGDQAEAALVLFALPVPAHSRRDRDEKQRQDDAEKDRPEDA